MISTAVVPMEIIDSNYRIHARIISKLERSYITRTFQRTVQTQSFFHFV